MLMNAPDITVTFIDTDLTLGFLRETIVTPENPSSKISTEYFIIIYIMTNK